MTSPGRLFDRVKSLDLYSLLGVGTQASKEEIKKAHNNKTHQACNVEKNQEANLQRLSDALEVLSDERTRAVYDNLRMVRKSGELRMKEMRERLKNLKLEIFKTEQEEGIKMMAAEDKARTAIDQHERLERSKKKAQEKAVKKSDKKADIKAKDVVKKNVKDDAESEKKKAEAKAAKRSKGKSKKEEKKAIKVVQNSSVTKHNTTRDRVLTPIKFQSGGFQNQKKDEDEGAEKPRTDQGVGDSKEFGDWEKHTKGVGSKLLLDMGFEPGKGLGKNLQGRSTIVTASGKLRKGKLGIGAQGSSGKRGKQFSGGQPTANPARQNLNDENNENENNNNNNRADLEDLNGVKEALPEDDIDKSRQMLFSGMMKHPQVIVGAKKTALVNFVKIAKTLHRQPMHLLEFLNADLKTTSAIQGKNQLHIEGSS